MKKSVKILTATAVAALLVLGGVTVGFSHYQAHHVKIEGEAYPSGKKFLDLSDRDLTAEEFDAVQESMEDAEILWNVPFQKRHYLSNVKKISLNSLTEEDVKRLGYLTELTQVDASNCYDYHALSLLARERPDCEVLYEVELGDSFLPMDTETIALEPGESSYEELMSRLEAFPKLQGLYLKEPELTAEELKNLQQTYGNIEIGWEKKLFGRNLTSDLQELDISGLKFETIQEVEAQTDYLPELKKLIMCDSGLENKDINDYYQRHKEQFRVIWNVMIGQVELRTDATWFKPSLQNADIRDHHMRNMMYCEDMVAVDMTTCVVRNLDWARHTPHLQYLILRDSPLKDIQPLRYCKELKMLELDNVDLRDIRPLQSCTGLEDLRIICMAANLDPLEEMTWLKNLWLGGGDALVPRFLDLEKKLTDTSVRIGAQEVYWRRLPNYQEMCRMIGNEKN